MNGGEQKLNGGNEKIKIAAIGDLHINEDTQGTYRNLFAEISHKADILLFAGDITTLGTPDEAKYFAEESKACSIPKLAVLGNHDHEAGKADEIRHILSETGIHILEGKTFEFKGVGFAGAKGYGGGFGKYTLGSFGEMATKHFVAEILSECLLLEKALSGLNTERNVVLLHYSPIPATVNGEPPEIFPFMGCSRLEEVIDRFEIKAVFHGHAHHGTHQGRTKKGIEVYNCAKQVVEKTHPGQPYSLVEI